jgi:hypothetical protein
MFHSAWCMLGLLFTTEDGGGMFLRNIGEILPDYGVTLQNTELSCFMGL